jgi:hypothetical protein
VLRPVRNLIHRLEHLLGLFLPMLTLFLLLLLVGVAVVEVLAEAMRKTVVAAEAAVWAGQIILQSRPVQM